MKLLYTIIEAADALSIGRTKMFSLIASGEIETVNIGRRRLVPAEALEAYVAKLRASS